MSRAFPAAACGRVHLVVALSLELVVQDASWYLSALGASFKQVDLLRTSYPNWGCSKHRALNSSSASARRVWERVAQKLAMGARTVVSSVSV